MQHNTHLVGFYPFKYLNTLNSATRCTLSHIAIRNTLFRMSINCE